MKIFIYALQNPVTEEIRYIGKTKNPKMRFHNHMNKRHNEKTHKTNWIESLKKQNIRPIMIIIDEVSEEDWKFWERYWISQFITWGFSLVNHTSGGEGSIMGNKTSFKKGCKSWNEGTAKVKILKGNRGKAERTVINQYKKGSIPWNKGITGYTTSKKGCSISEEIKQKISSTLKGKESLKKRSINQYDLNMKLVKKFNSITEAIKDTGIKGISNACTGRAKTAGGFIWQ